MPAVRCPGCKAHLSLSGATACPRCGAGLRLVAVRAAPATTAPAPGWHAWLGGAVLLAVAGLAGAVAWSAANPSAETLRARQVSQALAACQRAIAATSQYGGADTPPYVPDHGTGGEFNFAWPSGTFTFANGFGARQQMSASCTGELATASITHLTVNGRDVR